MKRKFLFVPMFAALLVASSCSKDDSSEKQNEEPQPVTVQVQKTYPITIKATKKSSISKISLGDSRSNGYEEVFDGTDELVLSWGEGENAETVSLALTDGDGTSEATFSGNIPVSADGKTITAYIGEPITEAKTKTSYASLAEAVNACSYLVSNTSFEYTAGADIPSITLDEQNAFIEITMSTMQHTLSFCGNDYTLNGEGKVWVAVAGGTNVYANFFDSREVTKGTINTINRAGLVDLGISDGILWADANVSGAHSDYTDNGNSYYAFANAGSDITSPLSLPTGGSYGSGDFYNLYSQCKWVWTGNGYNVFKKKTTDTYDALTDPHIFFPYAGYVNGTTVNEGGCYWSSSSAEDGTGYALCFAESGVSAWDHWSGSLYTIRAVRRKSL